MLMAGIEGDMRRPSGNEIYDTGVRASSRRSTDVFEERIVFEGLMSKLKVSQADAYKRICHSHARFFLRLSTALPRTRHRHSSSPISTPSRL